MAKKEELVDFGLNSAKLTEFSVQEFFDDSLRLYSAHSNVRGIPFIGDGFKEAQRKAMWGMLQRGENAGLISVERVSATCAAETDYHHGIGSMQGTIIGLAQNFAGSNNVNFLVPEGQFGSRRSHSASAPRYIETKIDDNFRKIFRKEDDIILSRKKAGDLLIEPKYFIPILPTVLLNGAEGMGTGHSTHIFAYSVKDIKAAVLDVLADKKLTPLKLTPSWVDFTGTVERDQENGQVKVTGNYVTENTTTIRVTELPVGLQSDAYEDHIWKLIDKGLVKSFKNASDDTGFDFILTIPRTTYYMDRAELLKLLKLEQRDSENFTVWGPDGTIEKYENAEALLTDFVAWRLERYEDRRVKQIELTTAQIAWYEEAIKFIEFYLENVQKFRNISKEDMIAILVEAGFVNYDRLLSMPIWSLTRDRIADLEEKLSGERVKLDKLNSDTAQKMYERELKELKL